MMKRAIAIILCLCTIWTGVPTNVFASTDEAEFFTTRQGHGFAAERANFGLK